MTIVRGGKGIMSKIGRPFGLWQKEVITPLFMSHHDLGISPHPQCTAPCTAPCTALCTAPCTASINPARLNPTPIHSALVDLARTVAQAWVNERTKNPDMPEQVGWGLWWAVVGFGELWRAVMQNSFKNLEQPPRRHDGKCVALKTLRSVSRH